MDSFQHAAAYADRIEEELRALNAWQLDPLPDSAYESSQAFFLDTMTLYQWLQFVLVPRVREIVDERGSFPQTSEVSVHAVREFDGVDEAASLIRVLIEFDEFIEGLHHGRKQHREASRYSSLEAAPAVQATVAQAAEPIPEPTPSQSPLEVMERYWQTHDPALLSANPHAPAGYDCQLAEHVFATATALIEITGGAEEIAEGVIVNGLVQADRGPWLVRTVLCKNGNEWRVDVPLSLARTTAMFLAQHNIHPPYTDLDDARGRAMQFWQHVLNHNDRWASELAIPAGSEIPHFGAGQMDEFFWYVGHTEENGTAIVRVVMNTQLESRIWLTRMVQRDGAWFVDLPATLAG